ncbi:CAAX prenyl protease [Linnemannia hyalina]|uniref:CAAX prenyl protease n=1 Tax=Linnemannia hyalina TaxID=64524 RepID=A0A9P8BP30_9FUNG|nr:CAAX prenyl protease [Linnemannia hyalina]
MLPFESAIPPWVAGCSCIFFATLFVGSLYLFPVKKQAPTGNHAPDRSQQRLDRDHPLVIKQRIKGIVLTSVLITLYLWVVFSISGAIPFDQATYGLAQWLHHIFTPLALVVILFLGPLVMMLIDSELPFQSRFYWRNQLQNLREWIGIRNYIVGPIAEEYIFRACMVSITATSGASPKAMIFGLPLVFGIGEHTSFV